MIRITTASTSGGFIEVTKAELDTLIGASGLTAGAFYKVSFIASDDFENTIGIFQADTTNQLSDSGTGLFLNADYNNVGTYPVGLIYSGIWTAAGVFAVNEVVAFNNLQWVNISGANTGNPAATPADWDFLPVEVGNGYILEADSIIYKYDIGTNDRIVYRLDKRGNQVGNNSAHTIKLFQWGSDTTIQNYIQAGSYFECANMIMVECVGNSFINSASIGIIDSPAAIEFYYNLFDEGILASTTLAAGNFSRNKLSHFHIDTVTFTANLNDIADNHLENINVDTCTFTDFYGNGCKGLTFTDCTNIFFFRNQCNETTINNAVDAGWEYCNTNNLVCNNVTGGTPVPATNCFSKCIFNNIAFSIDSFILTGKILNAILSSKEIQYQIITQDFDGTAGRGAIGSVIILSTYPVPTNYFCFQTIYDMEVALVGVGANLTLGIATDAPTGLISAAVGTVAAFNALPTGYINANLTTKAAALRNIVAAVDVAAITAGKLVFTVILKHANVE